MYIHIYTVVIAERVLGGYIEIHLYALATCCDSADSVLVTREALLSETGFEKVFRTQNWVRQSKLFGNDFLSCWGQAWCISAAAWTQLKLAYYLVSSCGLIVCFKEGPSAFCSARWLLEVFLVVGAFVGFRAGGRLPIEWLYWNTSLPLVGPACPSTLLPKFFSPEKKMNHLFRSIPSLIFYYEF